MRRSALRLFAVFSVIGMIGAASGQPAGASTAWAIVPSPNPEAIENVFQAVSCPAANDCVGVGQLQSGHPLTAAWDGASWTVVPSPVASDWSTLLALSCPSSTYCVAVGQSWVSSGTATFSEVWDGTDWTITPTPNSNAEYNDLLAVSCQSSTFCVAVGYSQRPDHDPSPLIELWNGSAWSIMPPARRAMTGLLEGVSCSRASRCVAVGEPNQDPGGELIEQWNGARWTVALDRPAQASGPQRLLDVTCRQPTYCVAVGGGPETLVDVWNGSTWSTVPSPNPSAAFDALQAVECRRANRCIAVGNRSNGGGYAPLIEAWDGVEWRAVKEPIPASSNSGLAGVACDPTMNCLAVGYLDGSGPQPKTLAYFKPRSPSNH